MVPTAPTASVPVGVTSGIALLGRTLIDVVVAITSPTVNVAAGGGGGAALIVSVSKTLVVLTGVEESVTVTVRT
jgi:hypothetical protein